MAGRGASDTTSDAHQKPAGRVGRVFIALYAAAYLATSLVFIAPLLVTLALKVDSLVGTDQAPNSLSLVAAIGSLVAMVGNPLFGRLSDRTTSGGACGGRGCWSVWPAGPSASSSSRWPRRSGWCWSAGAWRSCSSTRCWPRWWRCCPTRSRSTSGARVAGVLGVCLPDRVRRRHLRGEGVHRPRARDVPGSLRDRRVLHRAVRASRSTTVGSPARTSRPGHCGELRAPSPSLRASTPTSRGRSPAGSCSSSPTRSW